MLKNFIITSYRNLARNKSYFLLSVLGLSLGISCVIALYTIINFQSNYDKHQENYSSTYRIIGSYKRGDDEGKTATVPHPLSNGIREELSGVEAISNLYLLSDQVNIPQSNDVVKKLKQEKIAFVQPDLFEILTFNFIAGGINKSDPNSTFLSEATARKFFGSNLALQSILGQEVVLANKHTLTIQGIYEDLPKNTDFPFEMIAYYEKQEGVNPYFGEGKIWGRLNGGTSCLAKLSSSTDPIQVTKNVQAAFEKYNVVEGYNLELQPLSKVHTEDVRNYSGVSFEPKYKLISYTLAIFLALIGSINFINLTTARSVKRAREVGIRKVMGGRKSELMFQFILETFLIVVISLFMGFILGEQILILFNSMLGLEISIANVLLSDWIGFSVIVLVSMTALSGLYPAFILSRFSALTAIKIKISNIDSQSRFPLRKVLVGLQFGVSISLIIGAMVIFSQTDYMRNYNMGFQSKGIVTLRFPKPDLEKQTRLRSQLEQFPEIETVSLHLGSPMARTNNTDRYFNPQVGKDELFTVNSKSIDENYLDLFEIELLSGRNLTANDPIENILVTEVALSKFNLGSASEAVGKVIEASWGQKSKIIGVVRDFNARSLQSELMPVLLFYSPSGFYEIAMKLSDGTSDTSVILENIESAWDNVYPELLIEYNFLDDQIARRYEFESVMAKSISFFVGIALIISILGLYGLTDYMANAKRKEIGIRKVVGADIPQILVLFAKEVVVLLIISFAISAAASYWLMNSWLEGFEYHITLGWEILLGALLATSIISIFTMGSRSLAAAKTNPVTVLKDD
ncbi:MAG: FtsX-like permease family protein [Cyclobacteriaceae bacterium]